MVEPRWSMNGLFNGFHLHLSKDRLEGPSDRESRRLGVGRSGVGRRRRREDLLRDERFSGRLERLRETRRLHLKRVDDPKEGELDGGTLGGPRCPPDQYPMRVRLRVGDEW